VTWTLTTVPPRAASSTAPGGDLDARDAQSASPKGDGAAPEGQ